MTKIKKVERHESDFYPTLLPPGTRVLAKGRPGTIVTLPFALPAGYCAVKLDHRNRIDDHTYLGTQVKLAEVQSMMLMVLPPAPPMPVLWQPVVIRPVRKLGKVA